MHIQPYSIYVDKRPLKIAYLLNPNHPNMSGFDAVIEYNHSKWGGRFNPIILTDGKSFSDKWWKILSDYDPDVIKSLVPLEDAIVEKIHNFLSPIAVEVPNRAEDEYLPSSVRISNDGISGNPGVEKIAAISKSFVPSTLVLFDLNGVQDEIFKQFIHRNFGTVSHTMTTDRAFEGIARKVVMITDKQSLITALTEHSSYGNFIYPSQVCSIPNHMLDIEHGTATDAFLVVVGDSAEDLACFWNSILSNPQWKRTRINQLWLPKELASDKELEAALKQWIIRASDPGGSTTSKVIFASFSVDAEELCEITNNIMSETWIHKSVLTLEEPQIPCYRTLPLFIAIKNNMDLYRATGVKELLTLKEPDEGYEHECWVADVYIQYRPERYQNYIGKDLWWKLPKRNSLAHSMFGGYSRISDNGFPSIIMGKGKPTLAVELHDDGDIFGRLIAGHNHSNCYSNDPRGKFAKAPFYTVERSDKGRYLSGVIELFYELSSAYQILREHYWRSMFNKLTLKNDSKYYKKQEDIKGRILGKLDKFKLDKGNIEWWGDYLFKMANELASSGVEMPFKAFIKEAESELCETPLSKDNEQDLTHTMHYLMELNILLSGIRSHCPGCGYANWHHIDEATQSLKCKGCGSNYSLGPEAIWYYRLNSLVQTGVKQGLIPVLLVLGQIFEDCRESFMYTTSLEVFESRKEEPDYEIDLICIKDGKLIIGEIKQAAKAFIDKDFERMAEVAERIRPDLVIFSSLDLGINSNLKRNIDTLYERLMPLGIEVKWYQLHSYNLQPSTSL